MNQDLKNKNKSLMRKIQGEITWNYTIPNRNYREKEKPNEIINSLR